MDGGGTLRRLPLLALATGMVAAGVPAAYVLVSGGPLLAVVLLPLLGLLPLALVLLSRAD